MQYYSWQPLTAKNAQHKQGIRTHITSCTAHRRGHEGANMPLQKGSGTDTRLGHTTSTVITICGLCTTAMRRACSRGAADAVG